MMPQVESFASRIVMYALFGRDAVAGRGAKEAKGAGVPTGSHNRAFGNVRSTRDA
jgi:hypothetical protein